MLKRPLPWCGDAFFPEQLSVELAYYKLVNYKDSDVIVLAEKRDPYQTKRRMFSGNDAQGLFHYVTKKGDEYTHLNDFPVLIIEVDDQGFDEHVIDMCFKQAMQSVREVYIDKCLEMIDGNNTEIERREEEMLEAQLRGKKLKRKLRAIENA
jgi:hypothetical protein